MKENIYDNESFFRKYSEMERSKKGLDGAGEWHQLKNLLPDFTNKFVLDLGCGYGWHCKYAVLNGAKEVVGVDISEKMINKAKEINNHSKIKYIVSPLEDIDYKENSFDVVISSLTFHYVKDFKRICEIVYNILLDEGEFVFSVEHPVFTAYGSQDWYKDEKGNILHWPVDNYYEEGLRIASFLDEDVKKYHRTLTTYLNTLIDVGFELSSIEEGKPSLEMLEEDEYMKNELRRPMMLLIKSKVRKS